MLSGHSRWLSMWKSVFFSKGNQRWLVETWGMMKVNSQIDIKNAVAKIKVDLAAIIVVTASEDFFSTGAWFTTATSLSESCRKRVQCMKGPSSFISRQSGFSTTATDVDVDVEDCLKCKIEKTFIYKTFRVYINSNFVLTYRSTVPLITPLKLLFCPPRAPPHLKLQSSILSSTQSLMTHE